MTDVSSEHSPCMFCGSRYCDRMKCYDNADHPLQEVNAYKAYKKDAYKHMTCPVCGYTYSNIPSLNDVAHDNTCGE